MEGGAVEIGPFDWSLQLVLFEAPIDLGLRDARLRYQIGEDGAGSGYLGGRMMLYQIPEFLEALKSEAYNAVDGAMRTGADLSPDGTGACAEISAVFAFEAVPAFYFEGDAEAAVP